MSKKILFQLMTSVVMVCLCACFLSCSKDDDKDEFEPTENVSSQDPEGTIVLNMEGGASGNYYKIGELGEIHVDAANNFRGYDRYSYKIEFVTIGKVDGLSKVNQIPTSGWAESAAVIPGTGYMMRYYPSSYSKDNPQYVRIYVVDYLTSTYTDETGNTYGSTTGATIKYQAPLQQKINLDNSSLTFANIGNVSKSIKLKTPTHLSVKEKPEWCWVTAYVDSVRITVSENLGESRNGDVILSNVYGEAKIAISQGAIAAISFEKSSLSFTNKASTQSVKLKTPTYYEVEEKPDWCTIQISVDSITVSVNENKDKARSGNIILKNAIGKATIQVNQESFPAISFDKTSLTFSSVASSQTVKLNTPTSSEVYEKPDWCSVKNTLDSIVVSVDENLSASQRTGNIVLKNAVSTATLSVTQKASSSPLFEKGMGTKQDPYQIKTAQQLENISKATNSHFILSADIDLKSHLYEYGNGWEPINNFTGSLDGKGHSIKGLWMKRPSTDYIGLFSSANGATVSDIRIILDEKAITGKAYVGSVCGKATSCTFIKCIINGNVIGNGGSVGGLCGDFNGSIDECSTLGTITGNGSCVGGLCGESQGNITHSFAKVSVSGVTSAGGIIGHGDRCNISECFSEGSVSGSARYATVMGIGGNASNCYSLINIIGEQTFGICDTPNRCYYAGQVTTNGWFLCGGNYTYFDKDVINTTSFNGNETRSNSRSTADMMKQSTYESWDFKNTWKITEGKTYPTLRCFDK